MKKITIAVALIFSFGIMFTSCNETKKEVKEEATEQVQEVEKVAEEVKAEATEENQSEDVATATFQCPMKCEGDKTYAEAGACPTCKMDLKKVEEANDDADADKTEEAKEENHEGHTHD